VAEAVPLFAVFLLLEVGLLGLGLALAALMLRFRGVATAMNYAWFGVVILSGVFFPITAFPGALGQLSMALPTTYYVDLIKHFAVGSQSIFSPNLELASVAVVTGLVMAIGWGIFSLMETNAKNMGRIGKY